ncbi:hypothetical protein Q7P35_005626 [Cladosporium inversicolor]
MRLTTAMVALLASSNAMALRVNPSISTNVDINDPPVPNKPSGAMQALSIPLDGPGKIRLELTTAASLPIDDGAPPTLGDDSRSSPVNARGSDSLWACEYPAKLHGE